MEKVILTTFSDDDIRAIFFDCLKDYDAFKERQNKRKLRLVNDNDLPKYITKKKAAQMSNTSVSTIDNWRRKGWIKSIKIGEKGSSGVRIETTSLLEFLANK